MKWEWVSLGSHIQSPSHTSRTHRVHTESHDPRKGLVNSGPGGVNRKVQRGVILKDPPLLYLPASPGPTDLLNIHTVE